MNFLKTFFASCLGSLVGLGLLFVIMIAWAVGSGNKEEVVAGGSVLHLRLEAPIRELELEDPFAEYIPGAGEQNLGVLQIIDAIQHAATDEKIEGIYLNVSQVAGGIASIQEIRDALVAFKGSGKWIVAYADGYSEGAYYLCSTADKVYLNPEGEVEFNGLALETVFFKRLFDKLDIRPVVFRSGVFKGAVEPFMRENLSEENKLQLTELLKSMNEEMVRNVADTRKIPFDKLMETANKMLVRDAQGAVAYGLVDSLMYEDQVKDEMRGRLKLDAKRKVPLVRYGQYRRTYKASEGSGGEIAVIVADGDILPGKADQGVVGSVTIAEEIRKARTNDRVKAIVLRINSPGGVFQAADQMWREVTLATKVKPVIASMGDYAASGGYYLAMGCDSIVARPTTITGSIGVFSVLFDLSHFMGDKLGITAEEVKTGDYGQLATVTRTLTDDEKAIWQKQTDKIYDTFTRKAAEGRHMKQDDIKKIASGRVWSGSQAKDNGLADVLGGFDDAVKIAAGKAGVSDYKVRFYPRPKPFLERLTSGWQEEARVKALQENLGAYYPWFRQWEHVRTYEGVQARMPVEFQVK